MTTYGLSLVTFLPLLGAVLICFIKARDAARLVALVAALATFGVASKLAWDYGTDRAALKTVEQTFAERQQALLDDLRKQDGVDAKEVDALAAALADPARRAVPTDLSAPVAAAAREAFELKAAARVKSAKHLVFVEHAKWIPSFNIHYFMAVDGLSLPLVWLTAFLTVLCVVFTWNLEKLPRGYFGLFLLLETGLIGVFSALDFFLFYVFWEVVLLPMYFLIGIWGGPRRIYASIKFFIYTLVGGVLMLLAILAMYFVTESQVGFTTFNVLALTDLVPTFQQIGALGGTLAGADFRWWLFMAMFVGFAIKVPVFPFHTWLPDAHVEAPTSGSMILAGIMLKMGGYGFFRMMVPIAPDVSMSHGIIWFLALLGLINVVYGALVAMAQNDFKSLVAYSSISHMGYVLLGLAAMNGTGFMGGVLQMFNHGLSSAMMFCLVGVVYDRAHHRRLDGFGGLGQQMPYYFGLAIIGFFASLGLPGLNGFVSEALTFLGAYQTDSMIASGTAALPGLEARWIVYVSLLGIIFTAGYILWTVQRVFFGPIQQKYLSFPDLDLREWIALVPLALLCILFGVFPKLIIDYMEPSLNAILDQVHLAAKALK